MQVFRTLKLYINSQKLSIIQNNKGCCITSKKVFCSSKDKSFRAFKSNKSERIYLPFSISRMVFARAYSTKGVTQDKRNTVRVPVAGSLLFNGTLLFIGGF
jgi:hypothetical protein